MLYTEAYFPVYRYVVGRLEETYAGLAGVFFPGVTVPPVETLLLSESDYTARLDPRTAGQFTRRTPAAHGLLVIRESRHRWEVDRYAAHELVHRFIAAKYPAMPVWLEEGVATYLDTIVIDGQQAEVGRLATLTAGREDGSLRSLHQLATEDAGRFYGDDMSRNYHAATEFVRWLLAPHRDGEGNLGLTKWSRLMGPYAAGDTARDSPEQIAARVLPELGPAEVQAQVKAHMAGIDNASKYPIWVFPFPPLPRAGLTAAPADREYLKRLCAALQPH